MKKAKRGRPADPARRQENTRAILNVALDVFTENGFSESRMSDIAQRAGIAKGTLYLYFDSKEALFEGVLTDLVEMPWSDGYGDGPEPDEKVGDFVLRAIGSLFSDFDNSVRGRAMRLVFLEGSRFPALASMYYRILVAPALERVEKLADIAVERGELPFNVVQQFPMLVFAPGVLSVIWNNLFTDARKLDLSVVMPRYLRLLFQLHEEHGQDI